MEERLRGARATPELEGQPDGRKEGEGENGKGQEAFKRTGAITDRAPPRSMGAWPGTDGKIAKITWRAGYGGVFTLTGREHPGVVTAAQSRGEGSRKRRARRGKLAGCGTPYRMK
ncbi:hypothetical protein N7G274_001730 [Stereocaulon virgatum]|uniref:Uncharacterized protein n=1 Tax=Stereocaulon virgatum TaxID=373712 RepID=A0ABR4AS28_9LECA